MGLEVPPYSGSLHFLTTSRTLNFMSDSGKHESSQKLKEGQNIVYNKGGGGRRRKEANLACMDSPIIFTSFLI